MCVRGTADEQRFVPVGLVACPLMRSRNHVDGHCGLLVRCLMPRWRFPGRRRVQSCAKHFDQFRKTLKVLVCCHGRFAAAAHVKFGTNQIGERVTVVLDFGKPAQIRFDPYCFAGLQAKLKIDVNKFHHQRLAFTAETLGIVCDIRRLATKPRFFKFRENGLTSTRVAAKEVCRSRWSVHHRGLISHVLFLRFRDIDTFLSWTGCGGPLAQSSSSASSRFRACANTR